MLFIFFKFPKHLPRGTLPRLQSSMHRHARPRVCALPSKENLPTQRLRDLLNVLVRNPWEGVSVAAEDGRVLGPVVEVRGYESLGCWDGVHFEQLVEGLGEKRRREGERERKEEV